MDPGQPIAFEEVGARHLIDMEATNEASRPAGKVARVEKAGQRVGAGHAGSSSHAWQESGTRMIMINCLTHHVIGGAKREIPGSQSESASSQAKGGTSQHSSLTTSGPMRASITSGKGRPQTRSE